MATQGPPDYWDDGTKYQYRKHAGFKNTLKLIDIYNDCWEILHHQKPPPPPKTKKDILNMVAALLYILEEERELDLGLAKEDYDWLEEEVQKEMNRP